MDEVIFKRGDVIIQQDDVADAFYILEEGEVSVTVNISLIFE
jgi:CRP-like cAMP-binding protein